MQIPAATINGSSPSWFWLSLACSMELWINLVTPHTYAYYACVNSRINEMEACGCGGVLMLFKLWFPKSKVYLPNLHMNRYLGPFSISIIGKDFLPIHQYGQHQWQPYLLAVNGKCTQCEYHSKYHATITFTLWWSKYGFWNQIPMDSLSTLIYEKNIGFRIRYCVCHELVLL